MSCGWNEVEGAAGASIHDVFSSVPKLANGVLAKILEGSSGTEKLMASTKLCTSLDHFSGNTEGSGSDFNAKLHKCKLRANSGNKSEPDLLVSERDQISANVTGGKPDRSRMSLAASPEIAVSPFRTAVRNKCSNFDWSEAVMNESRILGIFNSVFVSADCC